MNERRENRAPRKRLRAGDPSLKIAVHPLFWVCGIYFCLTGELLVFLLLTLSALEHECAHAFAAARRGYVLNRVVLMPYGAVVRGDIGGISLRDELAVAAAGPLASGATALLFVALWWLFPESYAFTDAAVYACASLALVNLLPALPLDGGRMLFCALTHFCGRKRAWGVCRMLSLLVFLSTVAGFVLTCFVEPDQSLLFFAVFLGMGCLQGEKYGYERIRFSLAADLSRGLEEKRVAVSESFTARKLIPLLQRDKYLVLDVFSAEETCIASVRQETLCAWLESAELEDTVGEFLRNKNKSKNSPTGVEKRAKV